MIQPNRKSVAEGISYTVIPSDRFKSNYAFAYFVLPLTEENAAMGSLLPAVLLRGTEKYPTMRDYLLQQKLLYGTVVNGTAYKRGEQLVILLFASMLADRYAPKTAEITAGVCELLLQTLFCPRLENGAFLPEYVESEKRNQILAIQSLLNQKRRYARTRCTQLMCEGEPYAVNAQGSVEATAKITPASLYAFYENLKKAATLELTFFGKEEDAATFSDRFVSRFAAISRAPLSLDARKTAERTVTDVRHFTESMQTEQGQLVMGFRTHTRLWDTDSAAFAVFDAVFGGSPISKLFLHVREEKSLCYYCACVSDLCKGLMFVYSGLSAKNRAQAEAEILRQLDEIRQGHVTEEELSAAKLSLQSDYRRMEDEPAQMASFAFHRALVGLDADFEQTLSRIAAVTGEDLARIARKIELDTVYFLENTEKTEENA